MKITLPNLLTLIRVILIPIVVLMFLLPWEWGRHVAALLFGVASFTDWLDGYLARKWAQTSRFGAFLDPVADKLLVAASLVLIVSDQPHAWLIILAVIIIGREIMVSALREWMAELNLRAKIAVSTLGKYKTATQMLAIGFLLWRDSVWHLPVNILGWILLSVAGVLTVLSLWNYLKATWIYLRD